MSEQGKRLLVSAALVAVAVVWGSTFVMVKAAVASYPVYSFLGLRFAIACVAFAVIFPSTFRRFGPGTVRDGLIAGVFLTLGYVFQTLGLRLTSPSKAAFITGMFVVITPLLQAIVLRRMPRWTHREDRRGGRAGRRRGARGSEKKNTNTKRVHFKRIICRGSGSGQLTSWSSDTYVRSNNYLFNTPSGYFLLTHFNIIYLTYIKQMG